MAAYGLYNKEPVIRTFTGLWINPLDPKPEEICIEDIAHSLSMQCRFGGHTPMYYSVSEHSYYCAYANATPEHLMLDCLLHDASEAYLQDIVKPVKKELAEYMQIENKLMAMIAQKFGFAWPLEPKVKEVDDLVLQWEWLHVMRPGSKYQTWGPAKANRMFLMAFKQLT